MCRHVVMKQDIDRSSKKSYLSTFVFDDLVIKKKFSLQSLQVCTKFRFAMLTSKTLARYNGKGTEKEATTIRTLCYHFDLSILEPTLSWWFEWRSQTVLVTSSWRALIFTLLDSLPPFHRSTYELWKALDFIIKMGRGKHKIIHLASGDGEFFVYSFDPGHYRIDQCCLPCPPKLAPRLVCIETCSLL